VIKNRNIIPDFPREDVAKIFWPITGHDCTQTHLHRPSIYSSSMCGVTCAVKINL
jgi:hypothetical protein